MNKIIALIFILSTLFFMNNKRDNDPSLDYFTLNNIEALAHCESDVKWGHGKSTVLHCTNTDGQSYELDACDFDMAYETDCEGRPAQ